ncbi:MAG: Isoleucine--tRNA ligase [Mycoplasmataceae bacterium]|nr:MAG: Isoleucine--tRNA ligase [Mycoplasmataceae bacterium]
MDLKKIKDTLFLPKTNFSLRNSNHLENEKKLREFWEETKIYQKILEKNWNNESFILHSGPPYANGKLHIGHFLNFIIKDIIIRFHASQGKYTPFLLGWDTHGLPIEHKMIQNSKVQEVDLRQSCHDFALSQVEIQKEQLKKIGLFTDFEKYYITLDKNYEAEQIRVFGEMVKKGIIYQGFRPIYWSCGHETALAEAEIEYLDKKDTSLYFKIKLVETPEFIKEKDVNLLVWTTQPWTITANRLVAVKKTANYALVESNQEFFLILENQTFLLKKWTEKEIKIKKVLKGENLLGLTYLHPYCNDIKGYIVDGSDFIEEKEGTGLVHLAPAFGNEDFTVARREKILVDCPLEPNGFFNEKIKVKNLIGKSYKEVNEYVINDLQVRNLVAKKEIIIHSYPHDWRDKSPLIYRLTKQWFINIQVIKKALLENIAEVEWFPKWTEDKMKMIISARDDWCISRQRKWGVPIPVLYKDNEPILNDEIIDYIADVFAERGSNCWFDKSILSSLEKKFPNLIDKKVVLGEDIMDVWLDSGVSHQCTLKENKN